MRFIKILSIISIVVIAAVGAWNNLFVSEQVREIAPFNAVYTSGPINVYLTQNDHESITVRADSNLHEQIMIEVIDGELRIFTEGPIQGERVLDVHINYTTLDSIHASAQSTLTGKGIFDASNLKLTASGASEIKLQVRVDSLDLIMHNSANVQLAGSTNQFDLLITGFGDLMAYNLISEDCKAVVDTGDQSPGIARINAQKTLDVTIKGPRLIKYKGSPVITNKRIEGKGQLVNH